MQQLKCTQCGRTANIDNPAGWSCQCTISRLQIQIRNLNDSIATREADFIATVQQNVQLLPAIDNVIELVKSEPASLSPALQKALERLLHARKAN